MGGGCETMVTSDIQINHTTAHELGGPTAVGDLHILSVTSSKIEIKKHQLLSLRSTFLSYL